MKLILKIASYLFVLAIILLGCKAQDSCSSMATCTDRQVPLSLNKVQQLSYPLYLPDSQTLRDLNLKKEPTFSQNFYDELCEYIEVRFDSLFDTDEGGIIIRISNGCDSKYVMSNQYTDEFFLDWAEEQKAYVIDEQRIIFNEETERIRYFIFSGETFSETILFLESMRPVSTK